MTGARLPLRSQIATSTVAALYERRIFSRLSPIGGHRPPLQNRLLELRRGFIIALKLEHHSANVPVILMRKKEAQTFF